jgi:flagellar hook assembly protein FlgD
LKKKPIVICIVLILVSVFGAIYYLKPFNMGAQSKIRHQSSLTFSLSSNSITYGQNVTITATMSPVLQGKSVTIQFSIDSTTWYYLSSETTNSTGQYSYIWTPDAGSYYLRSTWSGDTNYYGATSTGQQLTVNKAETSTTCSLLSGSINYGANVTVTGTVNVAENDGTIRLQNSLDGFTWDDISSGTPSIGSYSFRWAPPALGTYYVRATWSGNQNYQDSTSASEKLTVLSGSLLKIVQQSPSDKANLTTLIIFKVKVTSSGSPISGATVKFYADGSSPGGVATQIGSNTTDVLGIASFNWAPPYVAQWQWYAAAGKTGYSLSTSAKRILWYNARINNLYVLPASSKNPDSVLNGQNTLLTSASSQTVTANPGASTAITVSYRIYAPINPNEIDQLFFIADWTPSWPPPPRYYYPVYDSIPGTSPITGSATLTITVPTVSGTYYLYFCSSAYYSIPLGVSTYTKPLTSDRGIHIEIVVSNPKITSFSCGPSPFSPNGDGTKDNTTIKAAFSATVNWELKIKDSLGNVIRDGSTNPWTGTGTSVLETWNGKDNTGITMADGIYTIVLNGSDSYGNPVASSATKTVVVDDTPPTMTGVMASPNPFNPHAGQTTIIGYVLSESCSVTIKIYDSTGHLKRALLPSTNQAAGSNHIVWDGKDSFGNVVTAEQYTIKISVTDKAGNGATPYPTLLTVTVQINKISPLFFPMGQIVN